MPEVDLDVLPRAVRAELRGLSQEAADFVGAHLVAAGQLIETDPELAYRHAEAARRRGSRLPVVREAAAETAYAAGDYAQALQGYRAIRRMTGDDEYLPVMADCERALGRPQEALKLVREAERGRVAADTRIELILVEAGIRGDLGQEAEAHRLLRDAIKAPVPGSTRAAHARLAYAFADALLARGQEGQARNWFDKAATWDTQDATDAADRRDALDGLVVEFDDSEDDTLEETVTSDVETAPEAELSVGETDATDESALKDDDQPTEAAEEEE